MSFRRGTCWLLCFTAVIALTGCSYNYSMPASYQIDGQSLVPRRVAIHPRAASAMKQAADLQQASTNGKLTHAKSSARVARKPAADTALARAVRKQQQADPGNKRMELARLYERRGQLKQAGDLYRELLRAQPDHAQANHRLGVVKAQQGELDAALEHFQAARKQSDSVDLLSDMGYALYLHKKWDLAEEVLREALEQQPKHASACNNLAMVLGEQGRIPEALALLRRVNSEAEAYANLAYLYTRLGESELAQQHYDRALTLDPSLRKAAEALLQVARGEARNGASAASQSEVTAKQDQVRLTQAESTDAQPAGGESQEDSQDTMEPRSLSIPLGAVAPHALENFEPANTNTHSGTRARPAGDESSLNGVVESASYVRKRTRPRMAMPVVPTTVVSDAEAKNPLRLTYKPDEPAPSAGHFYEEQVFEPTIRPQNRVVVRTRGFAKSNPVEDDAPVELADPSTPENQVLKLAEPAASAPSQLRVVRTIEPRNPTKIRANMLLESPASQNQAEPGSQVSFPARMPSPPVELLQHTSEIKREPIASPIDGLGREAELPRRQP